eukprot:jgi/Tetstr1/436341/TSEL_025178.t1
MSTSITTGMMNTPLNNLAGRSAVKKDFGSDPPPPDFSDSDTSSEGPFSILHGASDSDSSDIQWIKPSAVKPTLDLATVPVWDQNISTRDNAQAIKISLGSAVYLDTTKGKGTHQEQLILLAALRHATANYPMALAIVDSISTDSMNTVNNPSDGHYQRAPAERHVNDNYTHNLRNDYNHQNRPQRQQYWPTQSDNDDLQRHHQPFGFVSPAGHHHHGHHPPNKDSDQQPAGGQEAYPIMGVSPLAPHHGGLPVMLTCTATAPGGAATGAQEGEGEDDDNDELHKSWQVPYSNSDDNFQFPFSHPWRARHFRSQPIPTPIQALCLASPAFPTSAALAARDVHTGQGALRGDLPPPLPILTAAPLLRMPSSSLVIEHLFSPCHGPSAFEVEAVVEYGFSIHAFIGADPSTEARTMWPHHLHVISSKYPGRLPPSAFQDCHDGTPMNINDITITELERLRPCTLVVSSPPLQPWSRRGSRLDSQDHRSRAFASVIAFTRFYLSSQPTPVRYIVQNFPDALAVPEVLSSLGACNIVRAATCGLVARRDTLLWTIIAQPQDTRNCGNNVAVIKLADPGPFSGCRIYNPATGRKTPPLSMPAFQFSNADYLMDAFQSSCQQEGPHAPPPMLPSAALASAQEGLPPPHHNEQHPPHHEEGDATALSAPHTSKQAQLTFHYVGLSDYHPTLVASAIAAVVRPRSARPTALALPAPTVRVSTAPRNYQEDISSTRPDD